MKSEVVRMALWEGRFIGGSLLRADPVGALWNARHARSKLVEAAAMDAAWALPRLVVQWAYIRVVAEATTGPWGGTHPDQVTPKVALDRWTGREGCQAGSGA